MAELSNYQLNRLAEKVADLVAERLKETVLATQDEMLTVKQAVEEFGLGVRTTRELMVRCGATRVGNKWRIQKSVLAQGIKYAGQYGMGTNERKRQRNSGNP